MKERSMRYLLLIIAIWVAFYIIRHFAQQKAIHGNRPKTRTEEMVQCAHCGVHFPRSEALQSNDLYFCSKEHRDSYKN
jgi:uncharacterized protein